MRRRRFITLLGGAAAASSLRPIAARAQRRPARVGVLAIGGAVAAKDLAIAAELAKLGHVDGRNIAYELRAADGDLGRLPALARELAATRPDVLVSSTTAAAEALIAATRDIPVVITVMVDPVATGMSDSISRPSRNVTGFTSSSPTIAGKRLALLHELIPGLRRVAYLSLPATPAYAIFEEHVRRAAAALGIALVPAPIATTANVAEAFAIADREKVQAVKVGLNPINVQASAHIIDECLLRDLPAIHPWSFEVRSGALMSYGPALMENHAGAAQYVDRLLKGAKVSELPFQEPTEFKLAFNLRTARALKIGIPPTLLARADQVIE